MTTDFLLLSALFAAILVTVLARTLIKATLGLAVASVFLTIIMYQHDAALAAVFELSVCTGLISVVFVSTIGLTRPISYQETVRRYWNRFQRFIYLPFLLLFAGIWLAAHRFPLDVPLPAPAAQTDVRQVIWNLRHFDLVGQVLLLLIGVFGITTFFRREEGKK